MNTVTYKVPNITCGHCVHTIKMEVGDLEGVKSVDGVIDEQSIVVEFDDPTTEKQIVDLMTEIYYPPASV